MRKLREKELRRMREDVGDGWLPEFWLQIGVRGFRARLTPSNCSPSSFWRGMMVTCSISHRKAVSGGVRPGGKGSAMTWEVSVRKTGFQRVQYDRRRKRKNKRMEMNACRMGSLSRSIFFWGKVNSQKRVRYPTTGQHHVATTPLILFGSSFCTQLLSSDLET